MSAGRPSIPEGIGQKPQFHELKLELKDHKAAEFSSDDNIFKIKLKSPNPVKTTYKLTQFKAGEEKEVPQQVFSQKENDDIVFRLALPEPAWYKFNIFAAKEGESGALPNVFTYLIHLTAAKKRVCPYPTQFADWNKNCFLTRPRFLNTSEDLNSVEVKVFVKDAKRVAIKAGDEWFHLQNKGGNVWQGDVCLEQHRGKNVDVSLNACIGDDETKFATLLRYKV